MLHKLLHHLPHSQTSDEFAWRSSCFRRGMRVVLAGDLEALKEQVIACGIEVHRALGPGLLESIYQDCMTIELRAAELRC